MIYAMQLLSISFGYYIINTYKSFGETITVLNNDSYLTLVSSVSALFNALRFMWSGALDKLNFRKVYGFLCCLQIVLAFTVSLTDKTKVTYAILVCLTLFCIGGHFAIFPNLLK